MALLVLFPGSSTAEISRNVDSIVFSIHVDTASQLDLNGLEQHLELVRLLVQRSQQPSDVACCTKLEAIDLELFGTLGDGGDIIDSSSKWSALGNRKAFVSDISWCGFPRDVLGCASIGGERMAVALDFSFSFLPVVIAHERGHNAGLAHRSADSCKLMFPSASSDAGCLNVTE